MMTQPQKNRIFRNIVKNLDDSEPIFQLRLMFEHEVLGMDADIDEPVSLDHKLFDEDFLADKPKKKPQGSGILTRADLIRRAEQSFSTMTQKRHKQSVVAPRDSTVDPALVSRSEVGGNHLGAGHETEAINQSQYATDASR